MILEQCVDIRDRALGLADRGGGPFIKKGASLLSLRPHHIATHYIEAEQSGFHPATVQQWTSSKPSEMSRKHKSSAVWIWRRHLTISIHNCCGGVFQEYGVLDSFVRVCVRDWSTTQAVSQICNLTFVILCINYMERISRCSLGFWECPGWWVQDGMSSFLEMILCC